ncbi:MAG: hypothetical protein Fur0022_31270 [Anaerolineales bacterium]
MTGKYYHTTDTCPTNPTMNVTYSYDNNGVNEGWGRRTSMTDSSGSTSWAYDIRGRVTQETKTITGSGTFVTQWSYNSADMLHTMTYPANNASALGGNLNLCLPAPRHP